MTLYWERVCYWLVDTWIVKLSCISGCAIVEKDYYYSNIQTVKMAESQLSVALSKNLKLMFKVSCRGHGYILLQRSVNERIYKQCLFSNSWDILSNLLGSIAMDLHDNVTYQYQFQLHNIMPEHQNIKIYNDNVQLHFVDAKSGRLYSFWLSQPEFDKLMSSATKISQHLDRSGSITSAQTIAIKEKLSRIMFEPLEWDYRLSSSGSYSNIGSIHYIAACPWDRYQTMKNAQLLYIDMYRDKQMNYYIYYINEVLLFSNCCSALILY